MIDDIVQVQQIKPNALLVLTVSELEPIVLLKVGVREEQPLSAPSPPCLLAAPFGSLWGFLGSSGPELGHQDRFHVSCRTFLRFSCGSLFSQTKPNRP